MSKEEMLNLLDVMERRIAYGQPYGELMDKLRAALSEPKKCKYGDPMCPCQDGDMCHYEGENPMTPPASEPVQPSSPLTDEEIHAIPIDEEFAEETYRAGISISKPLLAFARLVERRVAAPPGYVMVPVEPTEEMVLEGRRALRDNGAEGSDFELQDDSAVCYKAMLEAAKGGE